MTNTFEPDVDDITRRINDPLPTQEDIDALENRAQADALLGSLRARCEQVDIQIEMARLSDNADAEWIKRANAYRFLVSKRIAAVRRRLPELPVVRAPKGPNTPGPGGHTFPPTSFEGIGSGLRRGHKLVHACQKLYEAYGEAMESNVEEAWDRCDEAYLALRTLVEGSDG